MTPVINTISLADVWRAIAAGFQDMRAAPFYSLSFGLIYAAFGWLILYLMFHLDWGVYAYPLATGFALVAPMAAAGLYEISRRIEQKQDVTLRAVGSCFWGDKGAVVSIMAVVTTFSYFIWLDIAAALYVAFWGMRTLRFDSLVETFLMTPKGIVFVLLGNDAGFASFVKTSPDRL